MRKSKNIAIFFLLFVFSGCYSSLKNYSPNNFTNIELENSGLVVGKVDAIVQGHKEEFSLFGIGPYLVMLQDLNTEKRYQLRVAKKGGFFNTSLPEGEYGFYYPRLKYMNGEYELGGLSPAIVVKAGEVTYVGNILYEIGDSHYFETVKENFKKVGENFKNTFNTDHKIQWPMTGLKLDVNLRVQDEFNLILKQFPELESFEVNKQLFKEQIRFDYENSSGN